MTEMTDNRSKVFDPAIQTESIAFDANAMLACGGCSRLNPPSRAACLYCSIDLVRPLNVSEKIRPDRRKLEPWENGYNIVLRRSSRRADIRKAASVLRMEADDLDQIHRTETGLPVARVDSTQLADAIVAALLDLNLECIVVSDEALEAKKPNIRISGLEMLQDAVEFKHFNTHQVSRISADAIFLIVEGMITETKTDSLEKRRRRGESQAIENASISADAMVLDIYSSSGSTGFRIFPAGFNFSCLGDQRGLLVRENWGRLVAKLKAHLPAVRVVDNYPRVISALGIVWPIDSKVETKGMIPTGFGKLEFGTTSSTSNLNQFNKFSRLQRHLL